MKLIFRVIVEAPRPAITKHLIQKHFASDKAGVDKNLHAGSVLELRDLIDAFDYESELEDVEK